jgi:O-antigen biosynthesis protein
VEKDSPGMSRAATTRAGAVDIIVPVFNAPDDLRRCIDSVLTCTQGDYRLIVIDDASEDPGVAGVFRELAGRRDDRIALQRNERNSGFTATANRGIALSESDIVLLNSDTIVTAGWLDALRRCAASDPRIATVTPFSNNAEICSFPAFCTNNRWLPGTDPEPVRAALCDSAVPTYPDLPTGVGFCMFMRRAAITSVGAFDPAFGAGYGEENDFCLRAARAGWRNVLADDAFVVHVGARSFAERKEELSRNNMKVLLERHPHYPEMVDEFIRLDPLRALREAASTRQAAHGTLRGVLHVIHHHGGGTETHVRALIDASRHRWRHYLAIAVGDRWQVEEHRNDGRIVTFGFSRAIGEAWKDFVSALCGTFGVSLIHVHNISGCRDGLHEALADSAIPFGYTVHDLNFACPTITFLGPDGRFCGGETDVQICRRCLAAQPAYVDIDVETWRDSHAKLVAGASFVVAPSRWAASMVQRYFARRDIRVIPHGSSAPPAFRAPGTRIGVLMPPDGAPVVAVLGAVGPDKGARRVERLTELARKLDSRLRLVVIGYLDVERGAWQSDDARLTVHGRYDSRDLTELLRHYQVRFVLFPSAGPETFSYTLSEAWRAGFPALVPPIGALEERVSQSGAGWVMTADEWNDEERMLARILSLAGDDAAEIRAEAAVRARAAQHASPGDMAEATLALYEAAILHRPSTPTFEFARERVRDALGYHSWTPPGVAQPSDREAAFRSTSASGNDLWQRVARRALAIRRTPVGRVLYRMTPMQVINALKARLD